MKSIDPTHIELIEAFLQGELDEKATSSFQTRLAEDPDFASSFEAYQALEGDLKMAFSDELKSDLQAFDKELPKLDADERISPWGVVLAIAGMGLILFGVFTVLDVMDENDLVSKYWEDEIGLPVKMSDESKWNTAMNHFKQEEWIEAEEALYAFENDTSFYFLAVIAFEQENYRRAQARFAFVPEESTWYFEARFREALAFIAMNRQDLARQILEEDQEKHGANRIRIKQLLEDLK